MTAYMCAKVWCGEFTVEIFSESILGTKCGLDIVSATTFSFPGIWRISEVYSVIKLSWRDCLEDQGGDTRHIACVNGL